MVSGKSDLQSADSSSLLSKASSAEKSEPKSGKGKGFWAVVVLAVLYILSPIDIIPESILGPLGYLDDSLVLAYLIKRLYNRFRR